MYVVIFNRASSVQKEVGERFDKMETKVGERFDKMGERFDKLESLLVASEQRSRLESVAAASCERSLARAVAPSLPPGPCALAFWGRAEVNALLVSRGLDAYASALADVDGSTLCRLGDAELQARGVAIAAHREALLRAVVAAMETL